VQEYVTIINFVSIWYYYKCYLRYFSNW